MTRELRAILSAARDALEETGLYRYEHLIAALSSALEDES